MLSTRESTIENEKLRTGQANTDNFADRKQNERTKSKINSDMYFAGLGSHYDKLGNFEEENLIIENGEPVSGQYYETVKDDATTPSSTTMQFKFEDDDYLDEDYKKGEKTRYKISSKGKLMIVIYALVVSTIIALIVLNARVLKSMEQNIEESQSSIISLTKKIQGVDEQIADASSDETISKLAEELGMIK